MVLNQPPSIEDALTQGAFFCLCLLRIWLASSEQQSAQVPNSMEHNPSALQTTPKDLTSASSLDPSNGSMTMVGTMPSAGARGAKVQAAIVLMARRVSAPTHVLDFHVLELVAAPGARVIGRRWHLDAAENSFGGEVSANGVTLILARGEGAATASGATASGRKGRD